MKYIKRFLLSLVITFIGWVSLLPAVFAQDWKRFSEWLDQSTQLIQGQLERSPEYFIPSWSSRLGGTETFIYNIVNKFVFPLLIVASILTVILGLYEIMFSGKEEIEKWSKYIIFWILGIVLIQSAKFITSTYIGIVTKVVPYDNTAASIPFAQSAYEVYNQLLMPFISLFMYIVIGFLFVILLVHVMRFITSSEEDVTAKAKTIMISNVVGILVILLAKTMVEAIYGKQAEVIKKATNVWDVGTWILAGADFTLVFSIVNYILWFLGFIILVIIVIQTYQLLVNPTDEALIKKTRTNLWYILIGLAIISLAYVIVNFLIIQ